VENFRDLVWEYTSALLHYREGTKKTTKSKFEYLNGYWADPRDFLAGKSLHMYVFYSHIFGAQWRARTVFFSQFRHLDASKMTKKSTPDLKNQDNSSQTKKNQKS